MIRKCKWCGGTFHPPHNRKGNNARYCSDKCRREGYKQSKKQYQKRHATTQIKLMTCQWCGRQFVSTHGRKYCSRSCKHYAVQEQNLHAVLKYQLTHGRDEKQEYYANLGNSNLREHRNHDFNVEARLILAEKRRIKL